MPYFITLKMALDYTPAFQDRKDFYLFLRRETVLRAAAISPDITAVEFESGRGRFSFIYNPDRVKPKMCVNGNIISQYNGNIGIIDASCFGNGVTYFNQATSFARSFFRDCDDLPAKFYALPVITRGSPKDYVKPVSTNN